MTSDETNNVNTSEAGGPAAQAGYQRGSSNNSLADRIVGGPAQLDRDDLLARGMTNQQVDALEVQARIAEELRSHIVRWVLCFMCTLCVCTTALLKGFPHDRCTDRVQLLRRCLELRLVEVAEPGLASHVCAGLMHCTKLRALKLGLTLVPNITNLRQVLQACKQLRVLSLSSNADHLVSLQYLSEELPKTCSLRELTVGRCNTTWKDIEALCKSAKMLQHLRLPQSFIEVGGPLNPPPLVPLARLKLRCVDFRVHYGRAHKNRAWLTDDMFGILGQMRHLRELRVDGQKLLSDRCFWFLRPGPQDAARLPLPPKQSGWFLLSNP
eukprot:g26235.t1